MVVSFDIETAVSILVGFVIIIGGIVALFKWLHSTANKIDKDVVTVQSQMKTSNGKTIANLIEEMSKSMHIEIDAIKTLAVGNREMNEQLGKRLDNHMTLGPHHVHDKEN